jgi:hypothetical protein
MKFFSEAESAFFWKLIYTLFVVKEIWSKEGVLHFRRFRLIATPWFNIYLHNILKSDEDAHPHDHPWHFYSLILWGGYSEAWLGAYEDWKFWEGRPLRVSKRTPGSLVYHHAKDFHKITLLKDSAWTLVFTFGKRRPSWGYQTPQGWIDFKAYRDLKNEGKLR